MFLQENFLQTKELEIQQAISMMKILVSLSFFLENNSRKSKIRQTKTNGNTYRIIALTVMEREGEVVVLTEKFIEHLKDGDKDNYNFFI